MEDQDLLKPGDHIKVLRSVPMNNDKQPLGFWHHGIYEGDGVVIDLTDKVVRRRSFKKFRNKCELVVCVRYKNERLREAVRKAATYVGHLKDAYHTVNYNCEHFVTEMITGKAYSMQSDSEAVAQDYSERHDQVY